MKVRSVVFSSVVLLIIGVSAQTAFADERTEARRHFRRGMDLVVQGHLDEGITELEQAYEILPHPNVLYNIGRAYAEAGHYEEAIEYFDRYLASGPPDTAEVRGYVAALNERIAARAAAEQATATATTTQTTTPTTTQATTPTGGGVRASAEEIADLRSTAARLDALSQILGGTELGTRANALRALADEMERANEAAATAATTTAATTPETTTTTTTTAATTTAAATTPPGEIQLAGGETSVYEERFVSSTRNAVDPLDAPNSTTIITRQDIRLTGITALGELLRRVAGVQVMSTGPSETNVGMRGFNQRISPRVLLLINGRSTYMDPLGMTLWQQQPVSVEDIERIEVVRGPASALYGANGFSGIVNVITRTPGDEPSTEFSVSMGSSAQVRGYLGTSGRGGRDGRIGYRMSVSYDQVDRFTMPYEAGRVDNHVPSTTTDPRLAQRAVRSYGNLTYRLGRNSQAFAEAGTTFFDPMGLAGASIFTDLYARGTTSYAMTGVTSGWGGLRFFWNGMNVAADQYGARPFPLDIRWNTYDVEGTFAHEFQTGSVHHNIVAGGGYRRKFVDWSNFLHSYNENHFQGFVQDSIRFGERFTLVAGARVDRHPLLANPVFSPRGAIVGRIGERQAIRASVSSAFRTQNFMESYLYSIQPSPISAVSAFGGGSVVNHQLFGTGPFRPERILSSEIGYQNSESDYFSFDTAVYFNRVQDLINIASSTRLYQLADALNPTLTAVSGFNRDTNTFVVGASGFENTPGVYYVGGAEAVARVYPVDGLDIYANYSVNMSYVDRNGTFSRVRQTPTHQVNAGVQYRGALSSKIGFDLAFDVHAQTKTVWLEQQLVGNAVAVVPFPLGALYMMNGRVGLRFLDDRLSVGVVGYNINGLWGPAYRQHPLTQPIDARVLGNVSYRF